MIIKKIGVVTGFLFLVILLLGIISADSCSIQSSCNAENTIMKLSDTTNAHGSLYNQGTYSQYLCCDFTGAHTCTGANKILGLSSATNAHAEIPSLTNYATPVCFSDLKCASGASCPSGYDIPMLSLSSNTNAHLGSFESYAVKICCKHSDSSDCAFTSASWSDTSVVEGTGVTLNVQGTNCDGETLSFEVLEADLVGDDPVTINPSNVVFSGNSATGTWIAEWQSDLGGDPEYYFLATVISTGDYIKSSEPKLTVTQTNESALNCTDISLCMDYTTQQTCEEDDCNVAIDAVIPDIDCTDPEINCKCSWEGGECIFSWSVGVCGDGIINRGETCDGVKWGPVTGCSDFDAFTGGSLSCVNCSFDTSQCTGGTDGVCGDGIINRGETCDGNNWGSVTGCSDFDAFTGGSLSCVNCGFNTINCAGETPDDYPSSKGLGTCFYYEDTNDNCDDGFLTYSWTSLWTWDLDNIFSSNPDGNDYVEEPIGSGNWHYDPERKFKNCVDGSNSIPCPAQIQLPFFTWQTLLAAIIILGIIYWTWDLKKRKTQKKKKLRKRK